MSRVALVLSLLLAWPAAAQVVPHRSFQRLVTGNGYIVASYDRVQRKLDFLLEHPYRFAHPRTDAADLCFGADESRDLLYDTYFGVRSPGHGEWTNELPVDDAGYGRPGRIHVTQHAGAGRVLRIDTDIFAPFAVDGAVLVMTMTITNESSAPVDVTPYALFNFHLGAAGGGREPSADGEQVSWDAARGVFYEYSDASQGTIAHVPLTPVSHASASAGGASAFNSLHGLSDLDDIRATTGPTSDVAPGLEGGTVSLAPDAVTSIAVATVWAPDEDAGPKVDALRTWAAGRDAAALVQASDDEWLAWLGGTFGADDTLEALLRMAQVREPGPGHGQILASLPPAFGDPNATWNIAWVRDMTYAIVALARTGHAQEAHDALAFMVHAGPGRHVAEVGMPYRISVTRYFGDGEEESDCNGDGPNVEFDGFGLFLWALDEYLTAGGDAMEVRSWFATVRDEIADVLVSLVGPDGVIVPDSSIWEVHWNGRQRRFTYTSLAAARGLCSAAHVATMLGETDAATRWSAAGARVRDAVVMRQTDAHSVLAQSAEDLLAGHGYLDASAVEAVNWGIVDPHGRTAVATLGALRDHLAVASGHGFMRNDDGGFYDSQEWVFIDERASVALRGVDHDYALGLTTWVDAQTADNDGLPSELYDPATADYGGSPPMIGFGAAAMLLDDPIGALPPVCGAYAPERALPLVDAGAPPDDAGPSTPPPTGCCSTTPGHGPGGIVIALTLWTLTLRRRVRGTGK